MNIEKTTQRIASGQKVNSVKDDGAAYLTNTTLNTQSETWDWRQSELIKTKANSEIIEYAVEEGLKLQIEAQKLLAFASSTIPGSAERQRFANEWAELGQRQSSLIRAREAASSLFGSTSLAMTGYAGEWAYDPYSTDTLLDGVTIVDAWWMSNITTGQSGASYTPSVITVNADFLNVSQAVMTQAANELLNSGGSGIARSNSKAVPGLAGSLDKMERLRKFSERMEGIIETAQAAFNDTDLEVEAARLQAAQVRAELSQSSISLFSEGFKRYASGLLGFVMNSQQYILRSA